MTDYDRWLVQLDHDRPDWALELADSRELLDALRQALQQATLTQARFTHDLLRSRVAPRLWGVVQSYVGSQHAKPVLPQAIPIPFITNPRHP